MPFTRPTLTELRARVQADIKSELQGSDPSLKYSPLRIMGDAQAGMGHEHYGYLDYIARQAVPFTATDEFLEGWAGLKGVTRTGATEATGSLAIEGLAATFIPSGTLLVRGDGVEYVTTADITLDGTGEGGGPAEASEPGSSGNGDAGMVFTLGTAIAGITSVEASTAFTGGADAEDDDSLRSRMLQAYASPAQGGNEADYVRWAREVPGVTRAWAYGNVLGVGTVSVYFMMDDVRSAFDGFPQGTDGGATAETRTAPATGDQLIVANHIYPLRPVTALVYAIAPLSTAVNFTIDNIATASAATKAAIAAAIADVFQREGEPGGTINLSSIESAIAAIALTAGFVITTPSDNIALSTGHLPVLGTVTYT